MNFKNVEELTKEELLEILPQVDEIIAWAKSIKEYCLNEALKGEKFNGWKLVEGKSMRKWLNEDEVIKKLLDSKIPEKDIYERKLLSPAKIEKIMGKNYFEENLLELVFKPKGAPTLVLEDVDGKEYTDKPSMDELNKIYK